MEGFSGTASYQEAWRKVSEAAIDRIRDSKRAGVMSLLAQRLSHNHRLYALRGEDFRKMEAGFRIPLPVQMFLTRFFVGLQRHYSILELDELMIGDNHLPGSIPVQGVLVPGVVKGKDEQELKVEVHGVLLITFSSIAVMPAQLSEIEGVSEVIVNFLPDGTAVCSFYDPETDNIVIDIVQ